jgi:hypothetical protein
VPKATQRIKRTSGCGRRAWEPPPAVCAVRRRSRIAWTRSKRSGSTGAANRAGFSSSSDLPFWRRARTMAGEPRSRGHEAGRRIGRSDPAALNSVPYTTAWEMSGPVIFTVECACAVGWMDDADRTGIRLWAASATVGGHHQPGRGHRWHPRPLPASRCRRHRSDPHAHPRDGDGRLVVDGCDRAALDPGAGDRTRPARVGPEPSASPRQGRRLRERPVHR